LLMFSDIVLQKYCLGQLLNMRIIMF